MTAVNRYYSSTAVDTTLAVGITSSATTMTVSSVAGFPTSYPYTLAVDYDTSSEELVNVVGASGTTLTLGTTVGVADITGRGVDQGAGYRVAHNAGAAVKHVISGRDVREPQEHIAATTSVHGIADTSALVTATSTTTMTNKSLTAPTITGTADVTAGTLALGTTGSITANSTTITATELGYVDGVTSNIQTQLGTLTSTKAPIASPTFTGTVTIPTGASITNPTIAAATLTGTISNSGTISGGTVSASTLSIAGGGVLNMGSVGTITAGSATIDVTEMSYLDGVTSSIQTQINGKLTTPTSWVSWTPVFSGTGTPAAGNATLAAAYNQVGKTVHFRISITYAATSPTTSFGTGVAFSLPATPGNPVANTIGQCISWVNGSGNRYAGEAAINTDRTVTPLATPATAAGASRLLTTAVPFTWGANDVLLISGTYEVA